MPEWAKVLTGCLVLIIIGASVPVLILEGLNLRQYRPPEANGSAKQESAKAADQKKISDATNNSAVQSVPVNETVAAIDKSKSRSDQTERGSKEEVKDAYFHIDTRRFKVTDFVTALFTAVLGIVGVM